MHIVACIKQVPDTTDVRIDPERGTLVREGVAAILNPLDAYAVEAAVRLAAETGGRATALTMGPPQAEDAVRDAVARGCDDGLLLSDRAFAGADTWATSYALAAAIRALGDVDLVLCGKQAVDGDTAQVGPGIAVHLGWPQATYVRDLRVEDGADGRSALIVERLTDRGNETLRIPTPAVLTAIKDLCIPRLPSLTTAMRARRCQVQCWGAGDVDADPAQLGLDGSPTRVVSVFAPPSRGECRLIDGEPPAQARELLALLAEKGAD
jgi:electron transfer flavoprotein alpha/beta subunit